MIYLDNAATGGKKPNEVISAVSRCLSELSANPGRGGHKKSLKASELVYNTRKKLSDMFGAKGEERVIFTPSCTYSLNFVIKGVLSKGDHTIISSLEHNAVVRPLEAVGKYGVETDVAEVIFSDDSATLRSFERLIKPNTKLIICTHASNVTGGILPIENLGKLCKKHNILFCVDAAQTAGILNIDMQKMNIDYLCVAPHKGLYSPMGCGILIANEDIPNTVIEGGTGVSSLTITQPNIYPEKFESGTLNLPAIAGISAGTDFVNNKGIEKIYGFEQGLISRLYNKLKNTDNIMLYSPCCTKGATVPVLSFNIKNMNSSDVAERLDEYNIAVRAGLHCAPFAHKRLGTISSGTVRVSPSVYNSASDIDMLVNCIRKIAYN